MRKSDIVIFNIKIGRIIIRDYITKYFKEQLRKIFILIEHLRVFRKQRIQSKCTINKIHRENRNRFLME